MSSPSDLSLLLAQTGWTRALARSLAADAHPAEDLVQDAWVAALERPPDLGRPVRGWLRGVLRHRWLDLRRAGSGAGTASGRPRRTRPGPRPTTWSRRRRCSELVEAVLELDEPYRTTVLLRFFEELPQREIARRMQTTAATVNSRLTRALARLRERMSRGGGKGTWLRILVPLLREPATVPAVALGAGAMKIVSVSIVVAASVLAGIALWSVRGGPPAGGGARPLPVEEASTAGLRESEVTVPSPRNRRRPPSSARRSPARRQRAPPRARPPPLARRGSCAAACSTRAARPSPGSRSRSPPGARRPPARAARAAGSRSRSTSPPRRSSRRTSAMRPCSQARRRSTTRRSRPWWSPRASTSPASCSTRPALRSPLPRSSWSCRPASEPSGASRSTTPCRSAGAP